MFPLRFTNDSSLNNVITLGYNIGVSHNAQNLANDFLSCVLLLHNSITWKIGCFFFLVHRGK